MHIAYTASAHTKSMRACNCFLLQAIAAEEDAELAAAATPLAQHSPQGPQSSPSAGAPPLAEAESAFLPSPSVQSSAPLQAHEQGLNAPKTESGPSSQQVHSRNSHSDPPSSDSNLHGHPVKSGTLHHHSTGSQHMTSKPQGHRAAHSPEQPMRSPDEVNTEAAERPGTPSAASPAHPEPGQPAQEPPAELAGASAAADHSPPEQDSAAGVLGLTEQSCVPVETAVNVCLARGLVVLQHATSQLCLRCCRPLAPAGERSCYQVTNGSCQPAVAE